MTPEIIIRAKAYELALKCMYDANRHWTEAERSGRAASTIQRCANRARRYREAAANAAEALARDVLHELTRRGDV